ncbi:hypothetical protein PBI_MRMAGOO_98 [Mycobacterium phage MrMagoo]|uniref:Uncharacterized protein n=1 Tax=Mycobacterium phage MrMagoo TaxID=1927020 RepID=A0A1L6BYN9_9CAUD|nr:hypothetical protein J4U04_gp098 [Mycobacterium phage MrMagoo]APQ42201.1 hypothetical protein PBI_MRMAGOO_98 [Mycobacterium phage MrMagoo]ARM70275.1 hypothetical protein SEA_GARDENSALSA_97 [Mycobacterium phage GardenSalsa]
MSDIDVMAAIIEQKAYGKDTLERVYRATTKSSNAAAQALYAAGFRMGAGTVDQTQNDRLTAIEGRLSRIEGYMVIR